MSVHLSTSASVEQQPRSNRSGDALQSVTAGVSTALFATVLGGAMAPAATGAPVIGSSSKPIGPTDVQGPRTGRPGAGLPQTGLQSARGVPADRAVGPATTKIAQRSPGEPMQTSGMVKQRHPAEAHGTGNPQPLPIGVAATAESAKAGTRVSGPSAWTNLQSVGSSRLQQSSESDTPNSGAVHQVTASPGSEWSVSGGSRTGSDSAGPALSASVASAKVRGLAGEGRGVGAAQQGAPPSSVGAAVSGSNAVLFVTAPVLASTSSPGGSQRMGDGAGQRGSSWRYGDLAGLQGVAQWTAAVAGSGGGQLQVQVEPQDLGPLLITVHQSAAGVSIVVQANQMQTVQWFNQHLAALQTHLEQQGMQVAGVSVAFGDAQMSGGSQGRGNGRRVQVDELKVTAGVRMQASPITATWTPTSARTGVSVVQPPGSTYVRWA
ncbi:MAG: flagellar hook-length control protein FliK [Alicyclobacillus sp.]|nr:flagellar hook-length control protein FliK [Alicyclobacillus sp.]